MIFVRPRYANNRPARHSDLMFLGWIAAALIVASGAGCGRIDQRADDSWPVLDVPGGVATVRWDPVVRLGERVEVRAERDQVIGTDDGWLIGRQGVLHATVLGDRLLVLSGIRGQLAAFRADGSLERIWADQGTGSGQLLGPIGIATSDDEVYVVDVGSQRILRWDASGMLVGEVSDQDLAQINSVVGASRHGLVVNKVLLTLEDEQQALSMYSPEGHEVERYAILPTDINRQEETVWPRPLMAVSSEGMVYASTGSSYVVHAYDPGGEIRWVLQVDWDRLPVNEAVRRTVERTRRAGRALSANVRDRDQMPAIPSALPALEAIEVDGHGRLYVFPLIEGGDGRYPVDVYSPSGERLVAGWLPFQSWEAQSGSHVYRIETDDETGSPVFVRYRLDMKSE